MDVFPLEALRERIAALAAQSIYIGTSSWKYEGWLGQLYTPEKYQRHFKTGPPKLVKSRFEKTCLMEYAATFKTVCLDAGFYQFPSPQMLQGYFSQVPEDFRLSVKVTEDITVMRFPNLPRYGKRAGQANPRFLDAELFVTGFLGPLLPYRERIGTLIFEFSHFHPGDLTGREFVARLDEFLGKVPAGWNYSIEIRNESLLRAEYFSILKKHTVAHCYNNWTHMPSIEEQLRQEESKTTDFVAARFLLKPGRAYAEAVKSLSPYHFLREVNPQARRGLAQLLALPEKNFRRRYIYINNRLEGSAIWTIVAALGLDRVS